MLFRDRRDAGRQLARRLEPYRGRDVVVLALPRGGVPVGFEVAKALGVPLDVFVVRKLRTPGHEELALGAVASGGAVVQNDDVVEALSVPPEVVLALADRELREVDRRERLYRSHRAPVDVHGRTAILADDGLATGATARAAIVALRRREPEAIVVAAPVAAPDTCDDLAPLVDDLVVLAAPEPFFAVGVWYDDFTQTTDDEVRALLERARRPAKAA